MYTIKYLIKTVIVVIAVLLVGCSNTLMNVEQNIKVNEMMEISAIAASEKAVQKINVQKRIGDENKYEPFKEISNIEEIQRVTEILDNINWENAIALMMYSPDYKFALRYQNSNTPSYNLWISPYQDKIELIIDGDRKYAQLDQHQSSILFELLTDSKLSDLEDALTSTTPAKPVQTSSYLDSITNDEHIREQLYRMYGRFNGLVGKYDNYKSTTQEEWEEYLSYTFLNPQVYERYAEVTSSDQLSDDFINLAALVTFARSGLEDNMYSEEVFLSLRYAYEIINDIQAWSLPQIGDDLSVRNKFGASFALEQHDQAIIINEWVATHLK